MDNLVRQISSSISLQSPTLDGGFYMRMRTAQSSRTVGKKMKTVNIRPLRDQGTKNITNILASKYHILFRIRELNLCGFFSLSKWNFTQIAASYSGSSISINFSSILVNSSWNLYKRAYNSHGEVVVDNVVGHWISLRLRFRRSNVRKRDFPTVHHHRIGPLNFLPDTIIIHDSIVCKPLIVVSCNHEMYICEQNNYLQDFLQRLAFITSTPFQAPRQVIPCSQGKYTHGGLGLVFYLIWIKQPV